MPCFFPLSIASSNSLQLGSKLVIFYHRSRTFLVFVNKKKKQMFNLSFEIQQMFIFLFLCYQALLVASNDENLRVCGYLTLSTPLASTVNGKATLSVNAKSGLLDLRLLEAESKDLLK